MRERSEKSERVLRQRRRKKRDSESSWIVGEREREGGMSPMAATHHSQLNDAFFFLFPLFCGRGKRGSSASVQSNGVTQSSYRSGGNVLHEEMIV